MRFINRKYSVILSMLFLIAMSPEHIQAQFMPVVYDRTYGNNMDYQHIIPLSAGEVAMVANNNGVTHITWIKRDGEVLFSRNLSDGFKSVNTITYLENNKLLIAGQAKDRKLKSKADNLRGRAVIVDNSGTVTSDIYVGETGSELYLAKQTKDGNLILAGYEPKNGNIPWGMISKHDLAGKEIYKYIAEASGPCVALDILGSGNEYVHAAFSSGDNTSAAAVRLDNKGKTVYATSLPEEDFYIQKIITSASEDLYVVGNSPQNGGHIIKVRKEGDIVFNKEIVPPSTSSSLPHLSLAANGNILVGGNSDEKCYYSLLRNDGTDLNKYILKGNITELEMNTATGESVIVGFDAERKRGFIIGLSKDGKQIYQKNTDANFDRAKFVPNGISLVSTTTSRVCMLTNAGELLFDRYAIEDGSKVFEDICFTSQGDIIFKGIGSHLLKMGHGLYVSDIKINKPLSGQITALFTVTLTGYSTNDQGVPIPVSVDYSTQEGTATEANNFSPVKGSLSFVPSNEGTNSFMMKQEIEVPIKANNLLEGRKMFEMQLSGVNNSYVVKPSGIGTIEDHDAFVRLVHIEDGLENEKDVIYELGIFKTNGEKLINGTAADISIDGNYGKGTADALDFDMGIIPRVVISKGEHTGVFHVKTLEDNRFELPKSVVVDFNKIYTINDVNLGFEASLLSCSGNIIDQPAIMAITSLGDHGRLNNIVSVFFTISLQRASDGSLLTNTTGGDIKIDCVSNSATTAIEGKDFVLTNLHDLRIWGDGNRGNVNLNGIVLFDKEKNGSQRLQMDISSIQIPDNAPQILVSTDNASAGFIIKE